MQNIIPQDDTPRKQCLACLDWHPRTAQFFAPRKGAKDGFRNRCRICQKAGKKIFRASIPEGHKRCTGPCQQIFPATAEFFHRNKSKKGEIGNFCKECAKATTKAYYKDNKEHCIDYQQQYRERYKQRIKEKDRKYNKEHRKRITERNKQYYARNREVLQVKARRYSKEHKDKISADKKRYYTEHRERIRVRKHQHYSEHKERLRQYRREHKEQYRAYDCQKRARRRAMPGKLAAQQIREKLKRQHYACYYCSKKFERIRQRGKWVFAYELEHTIPVSRTECNPRHDMNYVVLACHPCNEKKRAKLPHEWPEGGRLF